jgi:predicted PurR-regulated permease PerM
MRLRSLLVMLLISLFLAFALEPAANLLARRGWGRGWPPRPCSWP